MTRQPPRRPPADRDPYGYPPAEPRRAPAGAPRRAAAPAPQGRRTGPPPAARRTAPPPAARRTPPPPQTSRTAPPPQGRSTAPPPQARRTAPPPQARRAAPPPQARRAAPPRTQPVRRGEPARRTAPATRASAPQRSAPPRTRPAQRTRPASPPRPPRRLRLGRLEGRLRWGLAAVCVLLLVIGGRLVQLQGIDHGDYASAAAAQRIDTIALHAMRGSILDRFGTPMAYTSDAQDITADPKQIPFTARAHYAQVLAPLLGVSEASVLASISVPGQYAVLARALTPLQAQKVEDRGLVGVYTQATTQRQYPGGVTGGNILGTVHTDGSGAAGIEAEYNSVLAGHDGTMTYSVDNLGQPNPSSRTTTDPARNGSTVRLTVDQSLQYTVQQAIDKAVPESRANGASVAVLDVKTGQVLALASSGTLDPANPDTMNPDVPSDPAVMSAFEPGSVQKGITFSAAIEQHVVKPTSVIDVPFAIHMGGVKVSDAWYHATQPYTATGILAQSSNVGTLKIAKLLGPSRWFDYEQRFGVGQKTGVELPGESAGHLPPMDTWSDSTFANLPFGQGESMTILQMASVYQTIANNGVRIPPRIVQSVTAQDGSVHRTAQPAGIRAIQPSTARTVRTMLESVTQPGGTGVKAAIPGYRVAGKTGTAQQPDPRHGGAYSSYKNWDTFAGMVPADNPQFVVAIMVDNPAHGVEGGDVAAPLFHHIAAYELQHAHIPPTGSLSRHVPLMDCKGLNRAMLPANVC